MSLSHVRRLPSGRVVRSQVYTHEERLCADRQWAWRDADGFFFPGVESEVMKTLRRLAGELETLGVPYAVVGGMAINAHGYQRVTIDVDLVVSRESLPKIHGALDGRGWLPPFEGSKNLRDTTNGVRIDFLIAGGFPGDGKAKPVAFPDPAQAAVMVGGIRYVTLEKLIELKLASGMTGGTLRLKDLGDVASMIHALRLPRDFGDRLHLYVRDKFDEMWVGIDADPRKDDF